MALRWDRGLVVLAVASLPVGASADEGRRRVELGFVPVGASVMSEEHGSFYTVGAPVFAPVYGGLFRSAYLQWFATDKLGIEPQLSALSAFEDDDSSHAVSLATRASFHFRGTDRPSPYVFGSGGVQYVSWGSGDSHSRPSLGGGVGYRWPLGPTSVRVEAAYERAFDGWGGTGGANLLGVAVGVALRF